MFNFEKLDAWRKSIELADLIYRTTRTFPPDERFGLTNQLRRAAVSISSNLAEGCSRASSTDFARFVEIAAGSAFETASQSVIARNQGYLSEREFGAIQESALEITRMLSGLRRSLVVRRG
ncbi:MAG TPA: four helix bundle protein [Candidatus Didemnitutus sp.]|nr:four helix bundle protein [Candidatus Didemnitutus sp.]